MSRIFNRVVCFLLLGSVLLGCRGDNRLTIFEMVFPNITFDLPAGLTGSLPRVFAIDDLRTNYQRYLRDNNVDTALIQGIEPISATLVALDNERLDFLREISVRICREGSEGCTTVEEVFYLDNIQNERVGSELRLLPTLINAEEILSRDRFKLEVWFFFFGVSPTTIPMKLDLRFDAVQ